MVNADISATNLNQDGNSLSSFIDAGYTSDDFVKYGLSTFTANDRQPQGNDNLPTDYKSPLSVAAGVEYTIGSTLLAFTAEWFDKVDLYSITTPRNTEFLRPKSAKFGVTSDQLLRIRDGAKSVFNYGFGIEQPITKSVIILADYRINKSFAIQDSLLGMNMNVTDWDLYHFNAGVIFKGKIFDMNIGISYGYGRSKTNYQVINLTEPTEANFLMGETKLVQLFYDSWGVILGYTYYF